MPLYLVHGFKWPRHPIVMHVINNSLEAASPDWIMSPRTSDALLTHFRTRWPRLMAQLPDLRFMEQYDPATTQPSDHRSDFAFVADRVQECGLSVDATTLTRLAQDTEDAGALGALRDELAKDATVGWWVVFNGDVEREDMGDEEEGGAGGGEEEEEEGKGEEKQKG